MTNPRLQPSTSPPLHSFPPHESAHYHVTGEAVYIDDMLVHEQLLVGRVVYSPHAHARLSSFDICDAKKVPGVDAVICHKDDPGHNQMGPVVKDELCLAENEVICVGHAMFLIAAENEEQCIDAEKLIKVEYELLDPILTVEKAIEKNSLLGPPAKITRCNPDEALAASPHVIT